ncbi:MAG: site-specific integrase, partial [Muribaculum sp.]|nr:site-specific integrase [Muribaculum sp.]
MKCLYGVILRLEESGNTYNIDDIVRAFRTDFESGIMDSDITDFWIDKSLASVGKPFKEWLDSARTDKERYYDGNKLTVYNLPGYVESLLRSSVLSSRTGTVNNYRSTKSALSMYISVLMGSQSNDINAKFIDGFYSWLKGQKISESTISFYMRMLRAILNRAKEQGIIDMSENWFSGRITASGPNEDTAKHKALTKDEINLIANLDIEPNTLMDLSRDLFMFSFYCRGMELFDILNLTADNLQGNLLVYRKRLTGKEQIIKIDPQAQRIIDKYQSSANGYLFSTITNYSKSREYNTLR